MDYKEAGLTAGIEIHQQLNTKEKLFCHCQTLLRDSGDHSGEFFRYLRSLRVRWERSIALPRKR